MNLQEASERFHSDIATASLELDLLKEHRFVEEMSEILVEAGEIDDCLTCSYQGHGLKVDGYHFDEHFGTLYLIVAHWIDETDLSNARVTNTIVDNIFKRCTNFFERSLKKLYERIDISNEAHDLASLIYSLKNEINDVRIILITDGFAPKRSAEYDDVKGIRITRIIWDIERILLFTEKQEKEAIIIDFAEINGEAIPSLSYIDTDSRYRTYLSYLSGQFLADIYSQWGTKLLEMNVRVFLSARGKVNKGIRDTIIKEPNMFCAYNNGITVFAREIEEIPLGENIKGISKAIDFQIVNGGQTVASLYHTNKKQKADLSETSVQMKLIVINNEEDIGNLVPRISEYSNTQNRVSMADLNANDPPHPELHEISKRLRSPDPTGGSRESYWFYEKSRGSYEETKNLKARTPAQQKAFEAYYPKKQRFDKSLFGKVWNTFLKKPHIVCLGAQKNFANFNTWLKEQDEDWELFFKRTVALVNIWKEAEKIVARQKFEGYRHAIVTYTLAWIFEMTDSKVDLDKIWNKQNVDENILDSIEDMCYIVNEHIRNTDKNISEWCKKEECWKELRKKHYSLPKNIESSFISLESKENSYDPRTKDESEAVDFCKAQGFTAWLELSKWLKERNFLSPKARSQCYNIGRILKQNREPSVVLSKACKKIWVDSEVRGWNPKTQ
ncbi:AIPR family protein [Methanolobus sp. WCC5]|uniref:AIPR family protein n=1 Tax=Methanolobus sp. WCC5 TaxID=3125785 RepID=UPI00324362D1